MPDRRTLGLQLRIGVFVVVALVVFLGVIYLLGARARYFERKYDLHADFTEVSGLIEGATVRLAGVQIGRGRKTFALDSVLHVPQPPQCHGRERQAPVRPVQPDPDFRQWPHGAPPVHAEIHHRR